MKNTRVYAENKQRYKVDMRLSVNPLGCSLKVLERMRLLNENDISKYPSDVIIRKRIAEKFCLGIENVLMGCGSEQLIKLVIQAFVGKDGLILIQAGSFPVFTKEAENIGAKIRYFDPLKIDKLSVEPKLIIISNPVNPTGEVIALKKIKEILKKFNNSIVFVDEANGEYVDCSMIKYVSSKQNLLVSRTFSKLYGLAGLRIGYILAPEQLIRKIENIQQPFPISNIACIAAIAALDDQDFLEQSKLFIRKQREKMTAEVIKLGFKVSNSSTNNLFISSRKRGQMKRIIRELENNNVGIIDDTYFPDLDDVGFRISIKDSETNSLFIKELCNVI